MTSKDDSDRPDSDRPASPPPADQPLDQNNQPSPGPPLDRPVGPPSGPAPSAPPWPGPAYPAYPVYPPHPAYPFTPRWREPWINPARRAAVALVSASVAIVLLGGGILVGATVINRHDGHAARFARPYVRDHALVIPGHAFRMPWNGRWPMVLPKPPTSSPS